MRYLWPGAGLAGGGRASLGESHATVVAGSWSKRAPVRVDEYPTCECSKSHARAGNTIISVRGSTGDTTKP